MKTAFPWWPDWSADVVLIIACGPSVRNTSFDIIRGKVKTIGIKETLLKICPWADVAYGCDSPWWLHNNGLPEFKGLKFCHDPLACGKFSNLIKVNVDAVSDRLQVQEPLRLGAGGNSGFQALNLAVQFGALRIMLAGFDAHDRYGRSHWYGRNIWPNANNPDETNYRRWRGAFDGAMSDLNSWSVEVINLSPESDLKFKKMTIEQVVDYWKL